MKLRTERYLREKPLREMCDEMLHGLGKFKSGSVDFVMFPPECGSWLLSIDVVAGGRLWIASKIIDEDGIRAAMFRVTARMKVKILLAMP